MTDTTADDVPFRPLPAGCPYGLRRVRISELGSQETLRFEALLVHDGRDVAVVTSDGSGGAHWLRPVAGGSCAGIREFESYAVSWGAGLVPPVEFEPDCALIDELLWRSLVIFG